MMRRWLPYPLLAVSLLAMWLLLMQSLSPGQVLLGMIVSIIATWSMARVRPTRSRIAKWGKVAELAAIVFVDVVRSNFAVARIVLSANADRNSSFVRLPLELKNPNALACLALIITATPGTAWVQFDRGKGMLLIHVFDLVDEEAWLRLIKMQYEALLIEIFEA
jgi:multicomponent K+:H+ antiporter subunit E